MVGKVMDGIYRQNSTKFLFQASPTPEFAKSSVDEGPQHNELPQECSHCFQVWQYPTKTEGVNLQIVSARYMAQFGQQKQTQR